MEPRRPQNLAELKAVENDPVVVADHQGFIIYVNPQFEAVLGWSAAEIVGQLLTTILPSSFQDSHNLSFSRFQALEKANVLNHPLRLKTVTKAGNEIVTEHYIIAEKLEGLWHFGAMLRPL
ncbi:PAS domain-containing protein [Almyronema epifaneia]|uniref:PAS domain S-box protein n=1 Tax=Almyronema epifaneia S1 TaxID=2991925 RepID=A0ABW6IE48_9CYAN